MAAIKEAKMKPGEFKFRPHGDFIVVKPIPIESKDEKAARLAKLDIIPGAAPKNIIELERERAKKFVSYAEYVKDAVAYFEGKHGFQGIVMAVGPKVDPDHGIKVGQKVYHRGETGEPMVHNKMLFWIYKPYEIFGDAPKNEFPI